MSIAVAGEVQGRFKSPDEITCPIDGVLIYIICLHKNMFNLKKCFISIACIINSKMYPPTSIIYIQNNIHTCK